MYEYIYHVFPSIVLSVSISCIYVYTNANIAMTSNGRK